MKNIDTIKERLEYNFKSMKDFDPVEYFGGEQWKPHRRFENFKLTAKDLSIPEDIFEDLKHFQEEAWMFCDTIIMENNAERGYHILDYALHGERLGWKKGDEYWLVINCACKGRLELRKADPEKWTPLEKFYVDKNLNIKLRIYTMPTLFSLIFSKRKSLNSRKLTVKKLGINSFPDRIELMPHDENANLEDIVQYYYHHSSFKYFENNFNLPNYYGNLLNNKDIQKELKEFANAGGYYRHYNLYNENEIEDPEYYKNIFVKYCHDLHYRQKHIDKFISIEDV